MFLVTWLYLRSYNINSKSAKIFHFSQFPHKRLHLQHLIRKVPFLIPDHGLPGYIGSRVKID
jgi:hypothetical protein